MNFIYKNTNEITQIQIIATDSMRYRDQSRQCPSQPLNAGFSTAIVSYKKKSG